MSNGAGESINSDLAKAMGFSNADIEYYKEV